MIKNTNKIELLAPAGSPESLMAAVAAGADAVYLGLDRFNARTNAVNFTRDNLREHIEYCHVHGVRVYLTLNTVLYNDELQSAYETACFAYNNGIDAIIIQDPGLLGILKKELPDLELHASTQMSVNNKAGVEYMGSLGFSRVILAREMNLKAIEEAGSSNVATEVFIHGARCYSYSGQCLMSSMLGGRSGNRGNCAQPCRLPYKLTDEFGNPFMKGHLLSLKDTLYIDSLSALKKAGVTSLKIEGRMKSPEYVSVVTSMYRKYLDMPDNSSVSTQDMDELLKVFNREGYSKGALSQNPGRNEFARKSPANSGFPVGKVVKTTEKGCFVTFNTSIDKSDGLKINSKGCYAGRDMSAGYNEFLPLQAREDDIVYRTKDFLFSKKHNQKNIGSSTAKIPVSAQCSVKLGEKISFEVKDMSGNTVEATSESSAEKAQSSGTPCDRIKSQLLKTGGTPYEISNLDFRCDSGIYVKISDINDLRRNAFDMLSEKRKGAVRNATPVPLVFPAKKTTQSDKTEISVCFYRIPEGLNIAAMGADRVYADALNIKDSLEDVSARCRDAGIGFYQSVPYSCASVQDIPCDGYLIENSAMLKKLAGKKLILGTGFNITNSFSSMLYKDIESYTLSYEMNEENIIRVANSTSAPAELIIYGKPQVMESSYCPARDICSGDLCIKNNLQLTDRKDEVWDILFDPKTHAVRIFNPHRIMLTESVPRMKATGLRRFRINIFDESAEEVCKIIESVKAGTRPWLNSDYNYTRGHF